MHLANLDKIGKDKSVVRDSLFNQNSFDGAVNAMGNEVKEFQRNYAYHFEKTSKERTDLRLFVERVRNFAEEHLKNCNEDAKQDHSSRCETQAAFAEPTKSSLKAIPYSYMDEDDTKCVRKMADLIRVLISRRRCSIDLLQWIFKKSHILFILHSKPA